VETGIYLFPVRLVIIAGSMNRTPTLTGETPVLQEGCGMFYHL